MESLRNAPRFVQDSLLVGGSLLGFFHLVFLLLNFSPIQLNLGLFSIDSTVSVLAIASTLYGALISSVIYYFHQQSLLDEIEDLKKLRDDKDRLTRQLAAMKGAASNILVPFPLDQLVERGLEKITEPSYKPGLLQAQAVKATN